MTIHTLPRRQIARPSTHAVAVELDTYLALTTPDRREMFQSPALENAFCVELNSFDLATGLYRDAPPTVRQLAKLRLEAAREVDRLIALLDFIDGDPDLEPSLGAVERAVCCDLPYPMQYSTCQENWAGSRTDDLEDEHEGREPEDEHGGDIQDEPHDPGEDLLWQGAGADLSWPESAGRGPWNMPLLLDQVSDDDEDSDPANEVIDGDNGLADFDGMAEQRGGQHLLGGRVV